MFNVWQGPEYISALQTLRLNTESLMHVLKDLQKQFFFSFFIDDIWQYGSIFINFEKLIGVTIL